MVIHKITEEDAIKEKWCACSAWLRHTLTVRQRLQR